jgi:hypothetical protein
VHAIDKKWLKSNEQGLHFMMWQRKIKIVALVYLVKTESLDCENDLFQSEHRNMLLFFLFIVSVSHVLPKFVGLVPLLGGCIAHFIQNLAHFNVVK